MPPTPTDEVAEPLAESTAGPETTGDESPPEQETGQPDGDPEAPAAEPEPAGSREPADVAPDGAVEIVAPGFGVLSLDPRQRKMTPEQTAALVAIGIDTHRDPGITPHVRPFMHLCQSRGLDPWAKEAYLIGRGSGNNRKYTMQVGIDGYLKMASATGRFVRVAEVLWTGADDDDRSWREVESVGGRLVRKRLWFDAWPAVRGNPGQALVVLEHYDTFGNLTTTEAIADWTMYAPYNAVYEGEQGNRRKKIVNGQPVMELSEMWARGGAHMLAKCATALACRRAFPGATAGAYMPEEMHAADAAELARQEQQARNDRARMVQSLRPANQQGEPPAVDPATGERDDREPGPVDPVAAMRSAPSGPLPGVVDAEIVSDEPGGADVPPEPAEGQEREWLLAELDLMGRVLHNPPAALTRRAVAMYRKNLEDFNDEELLATVSALRPMVAQQLRTSVSDHAGLADAWAQVTPDQAGPTWWLLGLRDGDEPFPGDAPIG